MQTTTYQSDPLYILISKLVDLETKFKTLQTRVQYSEADLKVSEEKRLQLEQLKVLKETTTKALKTEMDGINKEVCWVFHCN